MSSEARTGGRLEAKAMTEGLSLREFALILTACLFVSYPEVVLGLKAFFFRDYGFFGYPLAFYHRESFWRGEIPLWNPLNNCGLPFLAQWNTLVLYPGSLLYLLFPVSWALGLFCLAHEFLAGVGMYCLAYRWTGNRLGAALAAMVFAFNGLTLNCLMWPNNIAALGWMPWVVQLVEHGWRQGGRKLIGGAVVGAVQMLTGAPEIIFLTWTLLGLMLFADFAKGRGKRKRIAMRFVSLIVLVSGLSAMQLLPFLDLLVHSQRNERFADAYGSMPPWGWANFLVPMFNCITKFFGIYAQFNQYWTSSYYVGVGTVCLAVIAVWRIRESRVHTLAFALLISLILALGDAGCLYAWLRKAMPQLGFMRYPIKFVVLAVFCFPLLAAFGLQHLTTVSRRKQRLVALARVCVVISVAMGVIVWFAAFHPVVDQSWPITWRNALSRLVLMVAMLALASWATLGAEIPRRRRLAGLVLVLLAFVDGRTHMPELNPTIPRLAFVPRLLKLSPQPRLGQARAMISPYAENAFHQFGLSNPFSDYLACRQGLYVNCNLLDDIPKVDGVYSLYLPHEEMIDQYLLKISHDPDRQFPALLNFLAVSHITAPGKFFDFELRPEHMPMATAGQRPLFAETNAILKAVFSESFLPRHEVYLPPSARGLVTVTNETQAKILISEVTAHRIEVIVRASKACMLVVAQSYYHPWRAYVDEVTVPIFRANYAYGAVEVPGGVHQVTLVYRDDLFHTGAIVSALTLAGCLGRLRRMAT